MGAVSETLAEKDTSTRSHATPAVEGSVLANSTAPPSRIVTAASESPRAASQFISATGPNPGVLERAQRSYGNRASQQIVQRATTIQRKCSCGGTCAKCQEEEEQKVVQRSADGGGDFQDFSGIPPSQGEPLGAETQGRLEQHFGVDLADVRVHANTEAAESARSLDALAYTAGRDIYFAPGMYAPSNSTGEHLLAHEVAHVVQQGSGLEPSIALKSAKGAKIGAPDDSLEGEADRHADAFLAGETEEEQRKRRLQQPSPGLTPVVQRQAATDTSTPTAPAPEQTTSLAEAVKNDNVEAALPFIRGRSIEELRTTREAVRKQTNIYLEHWLVSKIHASDRQKTADKVTQALSFSSPEALLTGVATSYLFKDEKQKTANQGALAEEGLQLMWHSMPLIDRVEIYDEGYREIEQAQLDTIRHATEDERKNATKVERGPERLEAIYSAMNAKEEYQARTLIDPSPDGLYWAAVKLLGHAGTPLWGDKDIFYDAVLALDPRRRGTFFNVYEETLHVVLWDYQFDLLKTLSRGSEAQALIARLQLATKHRSDDLEAVQAIVDRAVKLLSEKRTLNAQKNDPHLSDADRAEITNRLKELGDLESLVDFQRKKGDLDSDSFMGLVSDALADPDAFGASAAKLGLFATDPVKFNFESSKQRLLLAKGDLDAIRHTFLTIHAPRVEAAPGATARAARMAQEDADVELRKALLADPDVHDMVTSLKGSEQMMVLDVIPGDAFNEALDQLNQYRLNAQWGEFFSLVLKIAENDEWRYRYDATSTDPFGVFAGTFGEQREIMREILRTRHMPLAAVLKYTGNVGTLQAALGGISEKDRAQLREGWALARGLFTGPFTEDQQAALKAFQDFETNLRKSQGTDKAGFEDVLQTVLGAEPTAKELSTPEGRYNAAALMAERIEERMKLERGLAAEFTETDETMDAAGREFMALWIRVRDLHALTLIDFTALSAYNDTFLGRAKEFSEASKAITDLAGTIAATVAGIVVVAVTGGAATPAVIALAAAAGAGAGIVTREMFGGDYYSALNSDGARAALMDALNGALAVVSGGLASKGAELVGLGGKALTTGAAKVAGTVAEEATASLGRRAAASAVEAAIDGFFSGAVSEGFGVMLDDRTWRKGIMAGLLRVGEAAIAAGLTGMATGGVIGGATPVLGAGFSKLSKLAFGQAIDRTLAKAGASDLLAAARAAAKRGEVEEVNRLADQMEAHLSPQEANILRQDLRAELQGVRGRPPGTAETTKEEQEILRGSSPPDKPLTPQELDTEKAIVSRSDPQVSTEPGYVDEVDLGNGHTWRRTEEGTWCRFTKKELCGTAIPGVRPVSLQAKARARRVEETGDRLLIRGTDDPAGRAADIQRLKSTPLVRPADLAPEQEQLWRKYSEYYSERLQALEKGINVEPPRTFKSYSDFTTSLRRGTGFQAEEAEELIKGLDPQSNVGLSSKKNPKIVEGESETKFVDVLLKHPEQGQGRVGISFKARAFDNPAEIAGQVRADVKELIDKYSGERFIRRRGPEFGQQVEVNNLVLAYEGLRIRTIRGGTPKQMRMFIEMVAEDALEKANKPGLSLAVVFR
jgi:Domain of unknown function (DUF4157)